MPEFDSTRDLIVRGMAAIKNKQFDLGRRYLERALRLDPPVEQRVDALVYLVEIAPSSEVKRKLIAQVLAIDPSEPRIRRQLAILDGKLDPAQIVDPDRLAAQPVPTGALAADAKRFICPNCGGRMVFTPDGTGLVCEYCAARNRAGKADTAAPVGVAEEDFTVAMATARGHSKPVQRQVFACQGCGATFILPPQQLTLTCPYCESAYVVKESQARELVAPEGVIPFAIGEKEAQQALRDWLGGLRLEAPVKVANGSGLYLPAWTFDLGGQIDWRGWVNLGRDRWTGKERWEERVDLELVYCNDLLIPASQRLPEACRAELSGYNLGGLVAYDESYLADWPAETYQETVGDASLEARQYTFQKAQDKVKNKLLGQQVRDLSFSSLGIIVESFKLVLLPAWLTHYTVEEKRYDLIVNGQTGHVSGSRPTGRLQSLFEKILK